MGITVKTAGGVVLDLQQHELTDKVCDIKRTIEQRLRIPSCEQKLIIQGRIMENESDRCMKYGDNKNTSSTIHLAWKRPPVHTATQRGAVENPLVRRIDEWGGFRQQQQQHFRQGDEEANGVVTQQNNSGIRVVIKFAQFVFPFREEKRNTLEFVVPRTIYIKDLKQKLSFRSRNRGVSFNYLGTRMHDDKVLSDYGVQDGGILYVLPNLKAGRGCEEVNQRCRTRRILELVQDTALPPSLYPEALRKLAASTTTNSAYDNKDMLFLALRSKPEIVEFAATADDGPDWRVKTNKFIIERQEED